MKIIKTNQAPAAIGPYSQGVMVNGFYYFSGQIALTPQGDFIDGSIEEQTIQVLKNMAALLLDQDLDVSQVVKCTIFLSDMNDFGIVNKYYAEFFGEHKPARSTVAVAALPKNAKVEIEVVAVAS